MASVKLIFKTEKKNSEGKSPLYLRIIKNRKTQFISLGIYLSEKEWDAKNLIARKSHPNSARLNATISKKMAEALDSILELEGKNINVSTSKIKEKLKGKSKCSFTKYAGAYVDRLLERGKIGTHIKAKATFSKLRKFVDDRDLQFEDIDFDFLKRFEDYLAKELDNSVNTIHGTFRIIRKLINDATRENIIEPEHNPFFRFKLKLEKTTKTYLTDPEVLKIENLPLKDNERINDHRNLFVFACYAAGVRVSDLLKLRWKDFDGTHIAFTTQKTNDQNSIFLPNKALKIIQYYQSSTSKPTDYIFPFLDSTSDYSPYELNRAISSATAYLNKNLKIIIERAEINKPVSMHTSRHTWATRALRKGMRIEVVSSLLGHSSIKTTQIYAKIVHAERDKAMEVFNEN